MDYHTYKDRIRRYKEEQEETIAQRMALEAVRENLLAIAATYHNGRSHGEYANGYLKPGDEQSDQLRQLLEAGLIEIVSRHVYDTRIKLTYPDLWTA